MKQFFSDFFDVPEKTIEAYGAFNVSLVSDLPLFIDPFLLFNSKKPAYRKLHDSIIKYLEFLLEKTLEDEVPDGLVRDWFTFPEVKQNWFGYSKTSNKGHGLGMEFATSLIDNFGILKTFGKETVSSSHLEKLTLINDGVGRDNVSDFTTNLIKEFLCNYTQKFARKHLPKELVQTHTIDKVKFNYKTESWVQQSFELPNADPSIPNNFVLLTPFDILSKDDNWISRPDLLRRFQAIANSVDNGVLRGKLNNYFNIRLAEIVEKARKAKERAAAAKAKEDGNSEAKKTPKDSEPTIKQKVSAASEAIRKYPEVLDYFLREREKRGDEAERTSALKVVDSKLLYLKQFAKLSEKLAASTQFYKTNHTTYDGVLERIKLLKKIVEREGGNEVFHFGGEAVDDEDTLSILFRSTWKAGDPAGQASSQIVSIWRPKKDDDEVKVVLKLCSNTQLKSTLVKLRDAYDDSTTSQKYVLVFVHYNITEKNKVESMLKTLGMAKQKNVVFINAARTDYSSVARKAKSDPKSLPAAKTTKQELFDKGFGLLIGVGGDLPITVDDATVLCDVLVDPDRAAYPPDQVTLLTGADATKAKILDGFDKLAKAVNNEKDATVFFYYSGHGGLEKNSSDYFLVPTGFSWSNFPDSAISGDEFIEKIRAIKAKKLIVILDCCHAGGIPTPKALTGVGPIEKSSIPPQLSNILDAGSGQVMIASSLDSELSWTGNPYSVFTECLVDALEGKASRNGDGFARILDVIIYLIDEVPDRAHPKDQHPFVSQITALDSNFPICYCAGGASSKVAAPTKTTKPSKPTGVRLRSLQDEFDSLESKWKLEKAKVKKLREAIAIETDVLTKHKYEQQLIVAVADSEATASALETVEKQINGK